MIINTINIFNLAYNLIKFNGLSLKNKNNPSGDIEIKIVGLKKGEKLHEKLSYKNNLLRTSYKKILLCDETSIDKNFKKNILKLISLIKLNSNEKLIKNRVKKLI